MIFIHEIESSKDCVKFNIEGLYKNISIDRFNIKNGINTLDTNYTSDVINKLRSYGKIDITLKCGLHKILPASKNLLTKNSWKYPPYKHQLDGIEFGKTHDSFLLLDDPGMGKTLQMIYLAEELKEQEGIEHCLIVCGINALKSNWKKEINKFSNLSCKVLGEKISKKGRISYATIKERTLEIKNKIDDFFIITNIETLRDDNFIKAIKKSKNKIGMIVLDEAHKVKNISSQQGKNLKKLNDYRHKIALTGTLVMNKPLDAYAALNWIGIEKSTLTDFKYQYCVYGGFKNHQIVGYKNLDVLKTEIDKHSLRRKKSDLEDFPDKVIIEQILDMDEKQKDFYDNIKEGVLAECNKISMNVNTVLSSIIRLKQATVCPSILTTEKIKSVKLDRAIDLIEEIVASGDKVVVMSTFKQPLYELYDILDKNIYNPLLGVGDLSDDDVSKNIDLFQSDAKYKVFLATTSKCGTGINLNAASYMICIDMPWTYAIQQQSEDRINRVTNKKSATIYRLICKDTVDEVVSEAVGLKKAFSEYIVDDVTDDDTIELLRNYIAEL